jgi:hypothetical protein
MKKFFFYTSIFILCILIWLNIRNKEGVETQKLFIGLSAENLYDIYNAIEQVTEKTTVVSGAPSGGVSKIADSAQKLKDTAGDITSSFEFEDNNDYDDDDEPPKDIVTTQKTCPTKEEVINQLIELGINDDEFNAIINQTNKNKAYDDIIKQLKKIPTIPHTCSFRRKGRTIRIDPKFCNPICNCIKVSNMCKNYKYLQNVYNDQLQDTSIMAITKSALYSQAPTLNTAIDVDELKTRLKDFFNFMPEIP